MKKICLFLFAFIAFPAAYSQTWVEMMQDPNVNFFTVQQEFENYWKDRPIEKGKGWKQFKRWEHFMQSRVSATGERPAPDAAWREFRAYIEANPVSSRNETGNWTSLGPAGISQGGGAGRLTCVRFHPANSSIIFVGTPAGGLWKSTDAGTTWNACTDDFPVLGVTDIAINPLNPDIMYLATGDGDGSDTYSIGVLKSTNGGATWDTTGLNWTIMSSRKISKLIVIPSSPDIVLAATSNGIWRTTDGGSNWALERSGDFKDMELKPGVDSVIYASGTSFYRSTDRGDNFSYVSMGASGSRVAIAVTPADPDYVYALIGNSNGFRGIYRSTDGGSTFTEQSKTPNILGWRTDGSDTGGQAWYDLAIAASPIDKDEIYTGGVNIWKSNDGGTTLTCVSDWRGWQKPYVHADIHDLVFSPDGSTIFSGNDGGIFKSVNDGYSWTDLSIGGLSIAQLYRLSTSQTNPDMVLSGWQDNGTNLHNAGSWAEVYGGDGMECIIDHSDENVMYASLYYGAVFKSVDGGNSFYGITGSNGSGVDESSQWITPYVMSPQNPDMLLIGKSQLHKSLDGGSSWTQFDTVSTTNDFITLAIAPSDDRHIYAAKSSKFYVSVNGVDLLDRTSGLPVNLRVTGIAIHNTDPNKIWVSLGNFSSTNKVYYSPDAGVTWVNYSTGLPNLPMNTIVYQNGSADALYVGADVGVYYRDSTMSEWQYFSSGMPNVIVNELEIQYSSGMLRAATYGRGLWETALHSQPLTAPVADFATNATTVCQGEAISFTDKTTNAPAAWSWSFEGGTPASSTLQNPVIAYKDTGTYKAVLYAANSLGVDSFDVTVSVIPAPDVTVAVSDSYICKGDTVFLAATGAASYVWSPGGATTASTTVNPSFSTAYTVSGTAANGCKDSDGAFVQISAVNPKITKDSTGLTASDGTAYQWFFNGTAIDGATSQVHWPAANGGYSVSVMNADGCTEISGIYYVTDVSIKENEQLSGVSLYPNPTDGRFTLTFNAADKDEYTIEIIDVLGRLVYSEKSLQEKGIAAKSIDISGSGKGCYFIKISGSKGVSVNSIVLY